MEVRLVQRGKFADMRQADENDDGNRSGILSEAHANVAMEKGFPALSGREENGEKHSSDGTNNGI